MINLSLDGDSPDVPKRPKLNESEPVPTYGHAMALYASMGHKPGCPQGDKGDEAIRESSTGPCICVLHRDDEKQTWKWM